MPRKRRRHIPNPSEILDILVHAAKVSWAEIDRLIEIDALERRLKALRGGGEVPVPHTRTKNGAKGKRRAKSTVSPAVAATRKVQGQYIAHLRKFPKTARGKFQKIARTKSREEAISAMMKALA